VIEEPEVTKKDAKQVKTLNDMRSAELSLRRSLIS
jgi:hypothetical protein